MHEIVVVITKAAAPLESTGTHAQATWQHRQTGGPHDEMATKQIERKKKKNKLYKPRFLRTAMHII